MRESGPLAAHQLEHVEAVAVLQAHVDHREGRRRGIDLLQALGDRIGDIHRIAARFHGAGKALQEGFVVVDEKQRHIGVNRAAVKQFQPFS